MTPRHHLRNAWQGIILTSALLLTTLTQAAGLLQSNDSPAVLSIRNQFYTA
ncbi:MAG: hypothetical protein GY792_05230 [Gammaproteobacteria bacterium]|nr:hypothetical protein [Gammaproteobacteria bacterium]